MTTRQDNEPSGYYWTPPVETGQGEINAVLQGELKVDMCCRCYQAEAFSWPDAAPAGRFEVALTSDGRACGVLLASTIGGGEGILFSQDEIVAGPLWTNTGLDPVESVYRAMVERGMVDE